LEGKIQDQRTTGSDYFKTLNQPAAIYYTEVTFFSELRLGLYPKSRSLLFCDVAQVVIVHKYI
jgi:hypothetical protein